MKSRGSRGVGISCIAWCTSVAFVGLALSALAVFPARAGISFTIRPETQCAQYGAVVTAYLEIDEEGSEFDAYDVMIEFDGAMFDSVSVLQGPLMTGVCQQTWWYHTQTDSSVFLAHALLCGGAGVTGPGVVSSITFRAAWSPGDTPLHLANARFYRTGLYVPDVITHDGTLTVAPDCLGACCLSATVCQVVTLTECLAQAGMFLGSESSCDPNPCETAEVPDAPREDGYPALDARPNPGTPPTKILFSLPQAAPVRLTIFDAAGRLVRTLVDDWHASGSHVVDWDGRDESGRSVENGIYFYRIVAETWQSQRRMTLLR